MIDSKVVEIGNVDIYDSYRKCSLGYFSIILSPFPHKIKDLYKCREEFHYYYDNYLFSDDLLYIFYFNSQKSLNVIKINELFEQVEKSLGITDLSKFCQTISTLNSNSREKSLDQCNCFSIEISSFWRKNFLRLNFLTLVLRAIILHFSPIDDNWRIVIERDKLCKQVLHAIDFFMAGNTIPTFKEFSYILADGRLNSGFVREFSCFNSGKPLSELLVPECPQNGQSLTV